MSHIWKLKPSPTKLNRLLEPEAIDKEIDKLLDVVIKVLEDNHSESKVAIKDFFLYGVKDYLSALDNDCFYVRVTNTPSPYDDISDKLIPSLEYRGYKVSECSSGDRWGESVHF